MEIFYFLVVLIIFFSIILMFCSKIYNDFQENLLKQREIEGILDESIRIKYDLLINLKELFKNNLKGKELKNLEELENLDELKNMDLSSFEFNRKLIDFENKINIFSDDVKKIPKVEEYNLLINKINEINIKINADIKYFNQNINLYNGFLLKFPSNIVGKIFKFEEKTFFDNKNLSDNIKTDFKS